MERKPLIGRVRKGSIARIEGPVIDVRFPLEGGVPAILDCLYIKKGSSDLAEDELALEVLHHLGGHVVRCLAMGPCEGLTLGMEVLDSGSQITVPTSPAILGRLINALGEPIDESD